MNLDRLYELAFQYRNTKLWETVSDSEIFAVKLSNDRIGYISILGMAGQVFSIALYIGQEDYQSLLKFMYEDPYYMTPFEQRDFMLSQSCLQCSFENKEDMNNEEAESVERYSRSHQIKLSGDHAYPNFIKYSKYCVPWVLQTQEEADDLCKAISAAIELSNLLKTKNKTKIGLKEVNSRSKKIIIFEETDEGYSLGKTDLPKRSMPTYPEPKCDNEEKIAMLKTMPNKLDFECEIVRYIEPALGDQSEIPAFPVFIFAINPQSDFLLPVDMVLYYEDNPENLMDNFIESLLKYEICPTAIKTFDDRTYHFAKPLCEKLQIRIEFSLERSEAMENVQNNFLSYLDVPDIYEDPQLTSENEEHIMEMLEGLLGLSQKEVNKEDFLEFLDSIGSELPPELTNRIFESVNLQNSNSNSRDKVIGIDGKRKNIKKNENLKVSYVISVSLCKGCYRHIKISGNKTLDDLHIAINNAFEFDDDHLHAFFMDNKLWSNNDCYFDGRGSEFDELTSDYKLCDVGLAVGKQFKYLFDYGDEWVFQCKVLKILDETNVKTQVIKSVGEAPLQYENEDEDFDLDFLPQ